MRHTLRFGIALLSLNGCAVPMLLPASQGLTQATAAPGRAGCTLLSGYGTAVPPGGFGYAMSQGVRALQNFGGCAQPGAMPQQQGEAGSQAIEPQFKTLVAQKAACTEAVRARPEFARVAAHFAAPDTGQFSMEQLTDTARPTAQEAHLVARYYDASLPCVQTLAAAFAKLSPTEASVLDATIAAQQFVVTQLVTRRIGWGEFAQSSQKISAQAAAKFQTAGL